MIKILFTRALRRMSNNTLVNNTKEQFLAMGCGIECQWNASDKIVLWKLFLQISRVFCLSWSSITLKLRRSSLHVKNQLSHFETCNKWLNRLVHFFLNMRINVSHNILRASDFDSNYNTLIEFQILQENKYKLLILNLELWRYCFL